MIQSSRRYKSISELIVPQNRIKVKRCEERKKKMSLFSKRALVLTAVAAAAFVSGRLAVRAVMNLPLGGAMLGGNLL